MPTKEESKNGWTDEALQRYRAERDKASSVFIANDVDPRTGRRARDMKPRQANSKYSPFRWRG
jgi:hypothetical protein